MPGRARTARRAKPAPVVEPPPYEPVACCLAVEIAGVSVRVDDVPWSDRLRVIAELAALREAAYIAIPALRPTLDVLHGTTSATHIPDEYEGARRRRVGF